MTDENETAPPVPGSREDKVYRAKLAEQAERYDEMAAMMKQVVDMSGPDDELGVEERNLLSVAFKNSVGSRRASWRIVNSLEAKEEQKNNAAGKKITSGYRRDIENELGSICHQILGALEGQLLPVSKDSESRVFYQKMKGDYYRYLSEFSSESEESSNKADEAYREATKIAQNELPSTHPIRLGLALNYSVFYYEILNKPAKAVAMAKTAFDDAIVEFDHVSEDSYKDSTLIMQLLRDNLTLWTSDMASENQDEKQNDNDADPNGDD